MSYKPHNMYDIVRQSKLRDIVKRDRFNDDELETIKHEFNTDGINGIVVGRLIDEIRNLKKELKHATGELVSTLDYDD